MTEVFKLIVIAVLIVAVVIIISACISLAITFSRIHKEKYKTTEPICHYGEISYNDENSLEELENQQEPFYSTPYAHGVLHLIKPTKRNGTVYDASTRIHPDRGCKIHRCVSLPVISSRSTSLEQDNEIKSLNTRSCDHLPRQILYINDSDYLNPYCSLLRPTASGSDYLNPYTSLLTKTENWTKEACRLLNIESKFYHK